MLIQDIINDDNQLMDFYDSIFQYCPDIGISKGVYIIFYHSGTIDHGTYVSVPVFQSSA